MRSIYKESGARGLWQVRYTDSHFTTLAALSHISGLRQFRRCLLLFACVQFRTVACVKISTDLNAIVSYFRAYMTVLGCTRAAD